ncbi:MerR family transcriptional regulator [Nitrospira lenta]|uniref:MerR family transcriptional regulator n=1 Tax=Nitrospira lenta TaxID=1436998 RepID=UPI000EFC91FA
MSSPIMTTAEVARLLDVVPNTIRGYESAGLLPADRTATGVRVFRRPDVEAFAKRRSAMHAVTSDRRSATGPKKEQ